VIPRLLQVYTDSGDEYIQTDKGTGGQTIRAGRYGETWQMHFCNTCEGDENFSHWSRQVCK